LIWTTLDDAVPADLCTADERVSLVPGRVVELTAEGSRVQLDGPWGAADVRLPLLGRHNVHNALQAAAAASAISDNYLAIRRALAEVPTAPGRLERVMPPDGQTARPAVLVDYAHTHDALHNVLTALRPITPGRLIVVFGCGGDRDRTKRPKMARVAHELADRVWVTSDNPRTEDPQRIIDDILAGVRSDDVPAERVLVDRQAAIHAAVRDAAVRDTVLIAGKGHETYQILPDPGSPDGTRTIHFDDREHAAAALADYPTAAVAA
jgi:UDP-N-acetylmuramoyl-L-alanyl-D-glutamate--2,6-diaminopimelate ligase